MSDMDTELEPAGEHELDADEELEPTPIDEPDEPADEELEPELEPEPDDEPSSQAVLAALEKEERRHKKAIAAALGLEPEALHDCPTCQAVGYTPEAITPAGELEQDPYTETCPRCKGEGATKTGAKAHAMPEKPCGLCSGRGYVDKPEQPDIGAHVPSPAPAFPSYTPPPAESPEVAAALQLLGGQGFTVIEPIHVPPAVPA